jgi:hypothetical protein
MNVRFRTSGLRCPDLAHPWERIRSSPRRDCHARLPNSTHEAHQWVIAQIAPDFRLLDVWALPVEGGPDEFASFLEMMASSDPAHTGTTASRALFALRYRLGAWFGWDDAAKKRPIPGCTETTLSARLPAGLRGSAKTPVIGDEMRRAGGGFTPLYRTHREWAAELSNATVHGVLHLAWVDQGGGRYRAQMGVYVKPRGGLGELYMRLIQPFRHLIVYPALVRQIGRSWDARTMARPAKPATRPAQRQSAMPKGGVSVPTGSATKWHRRHDSQGRG